VIKWVGVNQDKRQALTGNFVIDFDAVSGAIGHDTYRFKVPIVPIVPTVPKVESVVFHWFTTGTTETIGTAGTELTGLPGPLLPKLFFDLF
jgi:hypothetical protein